MPLHPPLSVAVHPNTEPSARLEALDRFEHELRRVEHMARVVRVNHTVTRRWRRSAHQAELTAAIAGLEPLVADFLERLAAATRRPASQSATAAIPGEDAPTLRATTALPPEFGRARLGTLARTVGEARRALTSCGKPSPTGTDAALAAITEAQAQLLDTLVQA